MKTFSRFGRSCWTVIGWSAGFAIFAAACGGDDSVGASDDAGKDASDVIDSGSDVRSSDAPDASPGDAEGGTSDASTDVATFLDLGVNCGAKPSSSCAMQVAVGFQHGCAIFADGVVRCWGANYLGQLGNGVLDDAGGVTPDPELPAVAVTSVQDARQIALSAWTTCALDKVGSVRCWGDNQYGAAGQPDLTKPVVVPTIVALPSPAVRVYSGYLSLCAKLVDQSVWCWGWNNFGQLGSAPTIVSTPARVTALEGAKEIGSASYSSFAVEPDGGVIGMGWNYNGLLGRGINRFTLPFDSIAAPVVGLTSAAIGIGGSMRHGNQCAILRDRTLACWGADDRHQLGADPDASDVLEARPMTGIGGVAEVTAGASFICARIVDGGMSCWGQNVGGQCALPDTGSDIDTPTAVPGFGPIVELAGSDESFACALEVSGTVDCWGSPGVSYQTGQPDAATPQYIPSPVAF